MVVVVALFFCFVFCFVFLFVCLFVVVFFCFFPEIAQGGPDEPNNFPVFLGVLIALALIAILGVVVCQIHRKRRGK